MPSANIESKFAPALLKWFEQNRRDFPWRKTGEPYRIAIAEMMLQRTRANQVVPIYLRFIKKYPSPKLLLKATPLEIERNIHGLGLAWRTKTIHQFGNYLLEKFHGNMPTVREKLREMPGVGDYVADAILCFGYGKPIAIVDANVVRILERVFGIRHKKEARRDPKLKELSQSLLPEESPKEFNWAMIDLGSLVCTPKNPKCCECPLSKICKFNLCKDI